jgi:hypothetical protein
MIGWIGNVFLLLGLYLIGFKFRPAFLLSAVGEVIWTVLALQRHQYDLAFMCVFFCVMALRNFVKWGQDKSVGAITLNAKDLFNISAGFFAVSHLFSHFATRTLDRCKRQLEADEVAAEDLF